jgi:hypothetical protein
MKLGTPAIVTSGIPVIAVAAFVAVLGPVNW